MHLTDVFIGRRWPYLAAHGSLGLLLSLGVTALSGCGKSPQKSTTPNSPEVQVSQVSCQQLEAADEFTGRVEAVNTVEVRPRVSGYLQKVNFREGDLVRRGDLLFELDPRPFQAEVDRLKGDLEESQADLARADNDLTRAEHLRDNDGMSREEYDRRVAAQRSAKAKIDSAKGALLAADLRLSFTRITAPIDGRVGRAQVTEGNLVQEGPAQAIPLTTLVSVNPMYVYFDVDEDRYLRMHLPMNSHSGASAVLLGLADETGFPHRGQLSFVDNQVSHDTGTIRLRATFANPHFELTPGLFARIRLQENGTYTGCLVRDEAVVTDLNQKYVYVVGNGGALEYRSVILGPLHDNLRIVSSGLKDGDVIVVAGLQRIRPGINVIPKRIAMQTSTQSSQEASRSARLQ